MEYIDILFAAFGVLLGAVVGSYVLNYRKFNEQDYLVKADKMAAEAQANAKQLVQQARERVAAKKKQFEQEQQEFTSQIDRMDKMLVTKVASQQKRDAKIAEMQKAVQAEEKVLSAMRSQTNETEKTINDKLIGITGLAGDRIKQELVSHYEDVFKSDAEGRLQHDMEWTQECAVRDARNVLAEAIYKFGAPTSVEHGHGEILVPRDEIKGRIVGRGAKMIAFFEELFGVDVVFNDEPNTIIVSCFNLVQREIACHALVRLMREKLINEEVILRSKTLAEQDVNKLLRKEGEAALRVLELKNMPPEFAELVGRLKFRTSYGQNIMRHCFEVGYFAKMLASELGADTHVAFVGGFLHDIGKAIDQEVGGSHDVLTKEIMEKYGFSKEMIHAAWTHHDAAPQETIEAVLVKAADALSAGRPGARAESLERYIKKIKELQETALSFDGVKKAFAINAGRELRVVVEPEKVDDKGINTLAASIAGKVQEKGGYPGKIKITTIRVTKATDYARK